MAKTVTISLAEPLNTPKGPVSAVVLKEPTGFDYFSLGEPTFHARAANGTIYPVDNDEVIKSYLGRCVVEPDATIVLGAQLGLTDAMKVRDGLLDFFTDARKAKSATS